MATFTNQARLTYTGGSAASNITVGELVEVLTEKILQRLGE